MKEVQLTRLQLAKVDDEDFYFLLACRWSLDSSGYAYNSKLGLMHRHLMNPPKGMIVDHINGDKLDNRKANLRICTNAQNLRNQKLRKDSKTGFKGVYFEKNRGMYSACIRAGGNSIRLGRFKCPVDAAKAYNMAAVKLHGEFARLNPV